MNKIITRPEEIVKNEQVLYSGNHYLSVPIIDCQNGAIKNTIDYYYSSQYSYYFENARINELACDHHPHTPSGLGLCGSILNPLFSNVALKWLRNANMDYGLLAESFDKDSGEAKTGVGFASGCGYLAYSLYHALIKEGEQK